MKVCKMGLESIWINQADGRVRMCGWTNFYIGKLVETSIEELWHGQKAEEFRKSMLDGSYRYCNSKKCPYCANGTRDSLMVNYEVPDYPKQCSLSFEEACNYVCKFCRKEKFKSQEKDYEKFKIIEKEVNKFIGQLDMLSANGAGELFCSPITMKILGEMKSNQGTKVLLESNGSLFNEKNWEKIRNLGEHELKIIITVHSFREDTYHFLSGTKNPIDNVIHNLEFIRSLRKNNIVNHFEIATVVCERNFREMPDFVEQCLAFGSDRIRLRFFEPYGVGSKSDEWFYDIRNPYHPYYEEFIKVMDNPILKNPKVWKWQGDTLSDFKEHPYFKEQKKVALLSRLVMKKDIADCLENRRFTLYGIGYIGKAVSFLFDQKGIRFDDVMDSNAEQGGCLGDHSIVCPDKENIKKYDLIIVTSEAFEEIKKTLLDLGFSGCIMHIDTLVGIRAVRGEI